MRGQETRTTFSYGIEQQSYLFSGLDHNLRGIFNVAMDDFVDLVDMVWARHLAIVDAQRKLCRWSATTCVSHQKQRVERGAAEAGGSVETLKEARS